MVQFFLSLSFAYFFKSYLPIHITFTVLIMIQKNLFYQSISVNHRISVLCIDKIRKYMDYGFMCLMSSEIMSFSLYAVILVVSRNFLEEFFCIWNCRRHPAFLHIKG